MKKNWLKISVLALAAAIVLPASMMAQEDEKNKEKDKEVKERKQVEQIIITRKGDEKEKMVVEIVGDKVTVNGKPIEDYKDKDGNVVVRRHKGGDYDGLMGLTRSRGGAWNTIGDNSFDVFSGDANRAMLGVTTEKTEDGVKVNDVTKESAAEKLGLKEGDIITKINDTKIDDPDVLSKTIRDQKPGDKVTVTYLRDKKEQKGVAELTKWKGMNTWTLKPDQNFKMDMGDLKFDQVMPKYDVTMPKLREAFGYNWSGGGPKLGLSVQDTDEGKGVKVIEVDSESNAAKAGVKEDDVITEVDGKAVNSTDDMVRMIRESKEKTSIMLKLQRGGKAQNIEVKMPRRIKTADL